MSYPLGIRIRRNRPEVDRAPIERAPRTTIRRLVADGWSLPAAGNMAAYLQGLTPAAQGWTLAEIEGVLFLRWQNGRGRA